MEHGQYVQIYWNLHKRVFSVMALEGPNKGRVIAHVPNFSLTDARFVVREGGRQRVLREKRKSVHAFVRGRWAEFVSDEGREVTYNPYLYESFVRRATQEPIFTSEGVTGITEGGKAYLYV